MATTGTTDLNVAASFVVITALLLSIVVFTQILSSYATGYYAAETEIQTFIDAADFSIQENESYDADIAKVQRLEDKMRLLKLLREIQRCGDDLREDLNRLLVNESGTKLRYAAQLLWAGKRGRLEERVRRLDLLRMRFLVLYMGMTASTAAVVEPTVRDSEKVPHRDIPKMILRPQLPHALTEGITKKPPPLRRITTQAMGHNNAVNGGQRLGWAGVVQELKNSPLMHKRHASIDAAMSGKRPP